MSSQFVSKTAAGPESGSGYAPRKYREGLVRTPFDREYVRRLTDGDPETERHFTEYFGELLRIKLRARLRSTQMVEDLRQETFLRVLTALRVKRSLESPESLGAFVNSVCGNLLLELYRQQANNRSVDDPSEPVDRGLSAESALITDERKRQVREVLDSLPAKDRELLSMVFYDEMDRAEMCRRFHVDQQYLRVLVHRAKVRFKAGLLKKHGNSFRSQG